MKIQQRKLVFLSCFGLKGISLGGGGRMEQEIQLHLIKQDQIIQSLEVKQVKI